MFNRIFDFIEYKVHFILLSFSKMIYAKKFTKKKNLNFAKTRDFPVPLYRIIYIVKWEYFIIKLMFFISKFLQKLIFFWEFQLEIPHFKSCSNLGFSQKIKKYSWKVENSDKEKKYKLNKTKQIDFILYIFFLI